MFDVTRLRRLDALFAERVLKNDIRDDMCITPHYTRSLDAAGEGLQTIHLDRSEIRKITLWDDTSEGSKPYHASVWGAKSGGHGYADHPAEALVLACLRAVGCSEEEMK